MMQIHTCKGCFARCSPIEMEMVHYEIVNEEVWYKFSSFKAPFPGKLILKIFAVPFGFVFVFTNVNKIVIYIISFLYLVNTVGNNNCKCIQYMDSVLILATCIGNFTATARLYREQFSNCPLRNRSVIQRVKQTLLVRGAFSIRENCKIENSNKTNKSLRIRYH